MDPYELKLTWRMLLVIIKMLVLVLSKMNKVSEMEVKYFEEEQKDIEMLAIARLRARL